MQAERQRAIVELREKIHAAEILDYRSRWQNNDQGTDQRFDSRTNSLASDAKETQDGWRTFHELEEYILSDDDHRKRVAERNEAR
jgi:hypothetical protein